jgi:aminoglycoside 3-N-acetyltransferase
MNLTFDDLVSAWRGLRVDPGTPVLVHTSLSAFGRIEGGADTMVASLRAVFERIMMPTFTYQTMIVPESGPANNGITYGAWGQSNLMSTMWQPGLPAHALMGVTAEAFRRSTGVKRSMHPIQSFAGFGIDNVLTTQTLDDPLAPIRALAELDGLVLLLGVGHTSNTSIHVGEQIAGRPTFTRWALTEEAVVACKGWPACSDGFDAIAAYLGGVSKSRVGFAEVQVMPIRKVISTARYLVKNDPLTLLCETESCERCASTRVLARESSMHV